MAGGALGQHLYNKRKEYLPLLMGVGVLGGMAPLYAIINADFAHVGVGFVATMSTISGLVASLPVPNLRAVVLNVNEPELRGIAVALQAMTDDVGKGLGPFIVAMLIGVMGRQAAFNVAVAGWVPCAVLMLALCFTIRTDEAAMQRRLQQFMEKRQSRPGGLSSMGGELRFEEDRPELPVSTAAEAAARAAAAALAGSAGSKQELLMVPIRRSSRLDLGGTSDASGSPCSTGAAGGRQAGGRREAGIKAGREAPAEAPASPQPVVLADGRAGAGSAGGQSPKDPAAVADLL